MSLEKVYVPIYKRMLRSKSFRLKVLSLLDFVPDTVMIRFQYFLYFGRWVDLNKPIRFSEKLQWYKLNHRDPLMAKCADKVAVREFISERGFSDILTKEYAVYDNIEDVDFDSLPQKFVAKYNNGPQRNIIVKDKSLIWRDYFLAKLKCWLSSPLSKMGREWSYYNIVGKVLVEEYLEPDQGGDLIDYKFFCFNGEPKFLYIIKDRFSSGGLKLGIYDVDFRKLNAYRSGIRRLDDHIEKPKNFSKMLEVASCLSAGFPHVRVDMYNIDGRIVFGELTFYDGSGYVKYTPDKFDYEAGAMFDLPVI